MTFTEKQRFTQWWLWTILIILAMIGLFGIYWQIILGKPFGNNPMSDAGLIVFAVSMSALPLLFLMIRLKTQIDHSQIKMDFTPFMKKTVNWQNVETAKVVNYGNLGGWGIYHSSEYGTVYATGGDQGLAIQTKSGKKFVIGTQRQIEMKTFLEKSGHSSEE